MTWVELPVIVVGLIAGAAFAFGWWYRARWMLTRLRAFVREHPQQPRPRRRMQGVPPIMLAGVALQLRRAANELDVAAEDAYRHRKRARWLSEIDVTGFGLAAERMGSTAERMGIARGFRVAASMIEDDVLGSATSDERGVGHDRNDGQGRPRPAA